MKTRSARFLRWVALLAVAGWAVGSRATAQTPGPVAITREGSLVRLLWDCVPGRHYQLLVTADLGAPWLEVATEPKPLVAASTQLTYTLTLLPETQFYRVAELAGGGNGDTNNFQIEVTTTTSPQNFICLFENPGTLHVEWGDSTTNDLTTSITNTHSYAAAGVYSIKMSGHVHHISLFVYPGLGTPSLVTAIKTPILGIDGLTSAYEMFKGCENITSIPTGLFDACPGITSFYDTFINCKKVTSLPSGLFNQQTNVTTFYATFDNMDTLAEIPAGLFDRHTNVNNFAWTFAKCYSLTSIPDGLFDNNTNNLTFNHVFYRCYDLLTIPTLLFDRNTKVTTYGQAFEDCTSLGGYTPTNSAGARLWELSPTPTGTDCFLNCTGLSDYASIPAGWK